MQAAFDVVVHLLFDKHPDVAKQVVDTLYAHWRPEVLTKEAEAMRSKEAGEMRGVRLVEFYHWMRYAILSWVVSTVARPRTSMGGIDASSKIKYDLMAPVFVAHLTPVLGTPAYVQIAAIVRAVEDKELRLGQWANCRPPRRAWPCKPPPRSAAS